MNKIGSHNQSLHELMSQKNMARREKSKVIGKKEEKNNEISEMDAWLMIVA